jgi:DeoR family transcriptional regulator, suf operon transcriptional repressor
MSIETPNSDADLLDLLRIAGPLGVPELANAMEVTATAVRQRLTRLRAQAIIQREAIRAGRGRPKHRYSLTEKGLRLTGSNFTDLAMALWRELSETSDEPTRKEMLRRVAKALALGYAAQIEGDTPAERMRSLADLMAQRRISVSVDSVADQPQVLTAHTCPYPNLAEHDRDICAMEKMLFSELLGSEIELTRCRLDGATECRFQTH